MSESLSSSLTLLVIADPAAPHLKMLERLPDDVHIVASDQLDHLLEVAASADVILHGGIRGGLLSSVFPKAANVRWVHCLSAGVEHVLTPELLASPVPLTNGRGVFGLPLAEWVIAAALFFAKDLRLLVRNQDAQVWQQFHIEELRGRTMGIIGFGVIGQAITDLAVAFGMKVVALRRRPELSSADSRLAAVYSPPRLHDLLGASDYVVLAAPHTAETRALIGEPELRAMKPTAVLINVGRGALLVEEALAKALDENWIRGAALDVFAHEPLPEGHPFYRLKNLLLSPHSADHAAGWIERAMECFLRNFDHFYRGEPLENVVDKHAGY